MAHAMGDKFCLKWDEFQDNLSSTFSEWRNTEDAFTDVTLACDNDQFMESHKIVLSAASPFFMKLLQRTRRQEHPLIYLRGIEAKNLTSVLDFIYHGQANVQQEDLQNFLNLGQELQLKGLQGVEEQKGANRPNKKRKREDVDPFFSEGGSSDNVPSKDPSEVVFKVEEEQEFISSSPRGWAADQNEDQPRQQEGSSGGYPLEHPEEHEYGGHGTGVKVFLSGGTELDELDMQIAGLMEKGDDNAWTCKVIAMHNMLFVQ